MSSRRADLSLLTYAIVLAAFLPRLAHRGMFLDGITYAAISRNLAEGRGRFWEPFYTATIYPAFHEHPPLVFFLQSLWFRVLGDRWFVERAYCAAIGMATAVLIAATWRSLERGAPAARERDEWLPILIWISVPVVSWAIVGNMLEATVAMFVTAAVAALTAWTRSSMGVAAAGGAISGLCVAGAFLSKGPVGLFPLAAPMVFMAIPHRQSPHRQSPLRQSPLRQSPDRRSQMLCALAGQWLTVAGCALVLFAVPSAHDSLQRYLDVQVLASLGGRREVTGSSTTIIATLAQSVLPSMIVLGLLAVALARGFQRPSARDRSIAIAFLAIGLSGTVPLMVSPKQMGHYVMPAVSFFAIGAAAFLARTVDIASARLRSGGGALAIRMLAAVIAAGSIAAIWLPALEREPRRLQQLDRLAALAPRGSVAAICPSVNGDWSLHAWFQRRFGMSLDAGGPHAWFLKTAADAQRCTPESCRPASDSSEELVLLRCE